METQAWDGVPETTVSPVRSDGSEGPVRSLSSDFDAASEKSENEPDIVEPSGGSVKVAAPPKPVEVARPLVLRREQRVAAGLKNQKALDDEDNEEGRPKPKAKAKAKANAKGTMKRPAAAARGRGGRGRGGRGRGGRADKAEEAGEAEDDEISGDASPVAAAVDAESEEEDDQDDHETPPKAAKGGKALPKATAKVKSKAPVMDPAEEMPAKRPKNGGKDGVRRTFAGRRAPEGEECLARFDALRNAFDRVIRPKLNRPSLHEAG